MLSNSEHANPTKLELDGKGVDFIFPGKKKEGMNNPHLASTRNGEHGIPVGVLRGSESCLECVWRVVS